MDDMGEIMCFSALKHVNIFQQTPKEQCSLQLDLVTIFVLSVQRRLRKVELDSLPDLISTVFTVSKSQCNI